MSAWFLMLVVMHNAPPLVKCLLHKDDQYAAGMSDAAERLKRVREKAGYTSGKSAAEAMGVPVATYLQHESGIRGLPANRAERYARFFRTSPEWLLYGKVQSDRLVTLGPALFIIGEVAAGVFKEAWKTDPAHWASFTGRADLSVPLNQRFGLTVVGESMNLLYPPGTILECVEYEGQQLESGKRVIVQRTRHDDTVEATVKELIISDDGIHWLVPRSTYPQFQAFRADEPDSSDIAEVKIIGVVVASTRLE